MRKILLIVTILKKLIKRQIFFILSLLVVNKLKLLSRKTLDRNNFSIIIIITHSVMKT